MNPYPDAPKLGLRLAATTIKLGLANQPFPHQPDRRNKTRP
jgi:hypothetical protein